MAVFGATNKGGITEEERDENQYPQGDKPHGAREPSTEGEECQHQFSSDAESSKNKTEIERENPERKNIELEMVNAKKFTHRR